MKHVVNLSVFILFSLCTYCQDSVKIEVSVQSRDVKYIAAISSKDVEEDFFDATKLKYRVPAANIPSGTTLVVVDSMYTTDWVRIYNTLKNDAVAINAGVVSRVETALRSINQLFLNEKLDQVNLKPLQSFVTMQTIGLFKLRKLTQ